MTEEKKPKIKYQLLFFLAMILCIAGIVLFIFWQMQAPQAVSMNVTTLKERLLTEETLSTYTDGTDMELKRNFSLLSTDYPQVIYLKSPEFLSVDEVLIIEADAASVSSVYEAMNARKARQIEAFESYGTNQYEHASHALVYKNNGYSVYVCGENSAAVLKLIRTQIER